MAEEQSSPKQPEKASVSARMEGLGGEKKRPQSAFLAENVESIERAIERRIPMISIWEGLRAEGFTLTFKSFENALHRLRKRKAGLPTPKAQSSQATAPQAPPKVSSSPQTKEEDEESKAIEEFKKSIAHLPAVQQGRKMGDFLEKLHDNKMSSSTLKWLEKASKSAETSPTPNTSTKPPTL